jgi:hypothetical protein
VSNNQKEIIELMIPPYAVSEPTTITIIARDEPPDLSFSHIVFPGVDIEPGGTDFTKPVRLKVTVKDTMEAYQTTHLFQVVSPTKVRILGRQSRSETALAGQIFHLSTYMAATPTAEEAVSAIESPPTELPMASLEEFRNTYDQLIEMADAYNGLGRFDLGASFFDMASTLLQQFAENFLSNPVPGDPCGDYLEALLYLGEQIHLLNVSADLAAQFRSRAESIFNQCPISGYLTMHTVTLPPFVEVRYTEIPFEGTATGTVEGEADQNSWIGGPGAPLPDGRLIPVGNQEGIATIQGQLEIAELFKVRLKLTVTLQVQKATFQLVAQRTEGVETFVNVQLLGENVVGVIEPFFEVDETVPEDTLVEVYELEFPYELGAQVIQERGDKDLKVKTLWALHLKPTVIVTGIKPLVLQNEATGHTPSIVNLKAKGIPSGGTYSWSIEQGSNKVQALNALNSNYLNLKPVAASGNRNDIKVKIEYNGAEGETASKTVDLTCHKPTATKEINRQKTEFNEPGEHGYEVVVRYRVLDQFGDRLPEGNVSIDEFLVPETNPYNTLFEEKKLSSDLYSEYEYPYTLKLTDGPVPADYEARIRQAARGHGFPIQDHIIVWGNSDISFE